MEAWTAFRGRFGRAHLPCGGRQGIEQSAIAARGPYRTQTGVHPYVGRQFRIDRKIADPVTQPCRLATSIPRHCRQEWRRLLVGTLWSQEVARLCYWIANWGSSSPLERQMRADIGANVDPWSGTCGSDRVSQREFCKARTSLDVFKVRRSPIVPFPQSLNPPTKAALFSPRRVLGGRRSSLSALPPPRTMYSG
jgi:hypothetical protein